jgi:putative peptide maturation system protein
MQTTGSSYLATLIERLSEYAKRPRGPNVARAELASLLSAEPEIAWTLVPTWQEYERCYAFDVLVRDPRIDGMLSVTVYRDHHVPWTVLGAQRWSERDFVKVNGNTLKIEDVVAALDFIWSEVRIATRLIDMCLMRAQLEQAPIEVTNDELQRAMDEFRQRHDLLTVAATLEWLEQRGLSQEALEDRVADEIKFARLIDRTVGDQVDAHFAEHRDELAIVELGRYWFADEAAATKAQEELRAGAGMVLSPSVAARLGSIAKITVEAVCLAQLSAADREIVRASPPATPTLRQAGDCGYEVLIAFAIREPVLNDQVREQIKKTLFDRWLCEQRKSAVIEWNWGDRIETDRATCAARPTPAE